MRTMDVRGNVSCSSDTPNDKKPGDPIGTDMLARTDRPNSVARFIEPMLLLRSDSLPDDSERWLYELKLDGYRAIAFKRRGTVYLRSRNDNDFSGRYPAVVKGLAQMPDNTVIDGEVIAFDEEGCRH
jgi:bifunctional non-homologous end joining protein LigD